MKFAIVSDTHDNMANFNKAIDFLNSQKITTMLHCGDICNQQTIDEAVKKFKGQIYFVRGNGDFDLPNIPETMELELGGNPSAGLRARKIFFNHYPDIAKQAAESGKYDLVFYGHTHKPWEEKIGNPSTSLRASCRLVNPGELAGQRYKSCFAIYDTESDKLQLKILEMI